MKVVKGCMAAVLISLLAACASGITHDTPAGNTQFLGTKVSGVDVTLSEEAKKLSADNLKFNPESLRAMVQRALEARNVIEPSAAQRMLIEVTDFRVRSNFSAVMFGFMAGSDSVTGNIHIRTPERSVGKYEVRASYALGGFGGGQDDARMGWLYEEFAKQTLNVLTGESK